MWTLDRGLVAGHGGEGIKEAWSLAVKAEVWGCSLTSQGESQEWGMPALAKFSLSPFYSAWTLNTWGSAQCVQGTFPSSKNHLLNTLRAHPEVSPRGFFSPVGWQWILTIAMTKRLVNEIRIAWLRLVKRKSVKDQEQNTEKADSIDLTPTLAVTWDVKKPKTSITRLSCWIF